VAGALMEGPPVGGVGSVGSLGGVGLQAASARSIARPAASRPRAPIRWRRSRSFPGFMLRTCDMELRPRQPGAHV